MKQKFTFLLAAILLLTAKGMTAFGQTTYEKVTSAPTDWTGEYLLVFENDATTAYCWTGVDAASCYSELTISDNAITADDVVSIVINIIKKIIIFKKYAFNFITWIFFFHIKNNCLNFLFII